jgi:hypothetical protein
LGTHFRIHIPINRSKSEPAKSAGPSGG